MTLCAGRSGGVSGPAAQSGSLWHALIRVVRHIWPATSAAIWSKVSVAMLLMLASAGAGFAMSFAFKEAVNTMAAGTAPNRAIAIGLLGAYAAAGLGVALFANLRDMVFAPVVRDISGHLSQTAFRHLHDVGHRYHVSSSPGKLASIIDRGTRSIDGLFTALILNIIPALVQLLVVCLYFLWAYGMPLMVMTILLVVMYLVFSFSVNRRSASLQALAASYGNISVGRAVDSLINFETVQLCDGPLNEETRYSEPLQRGLSAHHANKVCFSWLFIGQALFSHLLIFLVMAYTVAGWSNGGFSVGDVVLVNVLLMMLFQPVEAMSQVYIVVQQGLVDITELFRIIDTPKEVPDRPAAEELQLSKGDVRFDRVVFGYDRERSVINDISFVVPAGTCVAIVGSSGAGKSTIARLILRQYDVDSGGISIDGQDIRQFSQQSLRASIAIVPQAIELFDDSIAYNICYGAHQASPEEIAAAVNAANLEQVIDQLPEGLETPVGERGLRLSGGERQRVVIARALLRRSSILILDEATSALDSQTESAIQSVLWSGEGARTTILIAHRLSTVVRADEIIVLNEGRIAERGSHCALLATGRLYPMMWASQVSAADDGRLQRVLDRDAG